MTPHDPLRPSSTASVAPPPPTDLPYLPPVAPTVHRSAVSDPIVPPTAFAPFGPVDATTHLPPVTSPTTPTSPAAIPPIVGLDQARSTARRQQRRAAAFGWAFAIAAIGGASTAGYYGYREWTADQEAAMPDAPDAGPSAAGNTDQIIGGAEIDRVLDMLPEDTTPETAAPAPGPSGPPLEIALGAFGGPPRVGPAMITPGENGAPPAEPGRSRGVVVRVYSGTGAITYVVNADLVADVSTVATYDDDGNASKDGTQVLAYAGPWQYAVAADRTIQRTARSAASLDPGPDLSISTGIDLGQLVPDSMRPFIDEDYILIDDNEFFIGTDGPDGLLMVDFAAFRAADPDGAAAWEARWENPVPSDPSLTEGPSATNAGLVGQNVIDVWRRQARRESPSLVSKGTAIAYSLSDDGRIERAIIHSPELGLRVDYVDLGADAFPIVFDAGESGWS